MHLLNRVPMSPHTEDVYHYDESNPHNSRGHAVVLIGMTSYQGCLWFIVRDGDHTTTAKNTMLPWSGACSSTMGHRSLWDAMLASFHVNA